MSLKCRLFDQQSYLTRQLASGSLIVYSNYTEEMLDPNGDGITKKHCPFLQLTQPCKGLHGNMIDNIIKNNLGFVPKPLNSEI